MLSDVTDPIAGPGPILIKVATARATFIETQVKVGTFALQPMTDE